MTVDWEEQHQKNMERLKKLCLMDNDFFVKCFDGDTICVQLILRIVLDKPDLEVQEVRVQKFYGNLWNRSVWLDIVATDSANKIYNIEIQRASAGAEPTRARYHSSTIDTDHLEKGQDFNELPESYVIFVTEHDVLRGGLSVYHIDRYITELQKPFQDKAHIVYVNGAYKGDDPIGYLMHDFRCTDPSEMHYDVLADKARFFKEKEEGVNIMYDAFREMQEEFLNKGKELGREEGREEGREDTAIEVAKRMIADGLTDEKAAQYSGLSLARILQLRTDWVHDSTPA